MITSENMRCGMCFSPSVNKVEENLFRCDSCGQKYPQHLINYNCVDCNKVWRIDLDLTNGWYYVMSMNYSFVYQHLNKRCPKCSEIYKLMRENGLHPLLFE